MTAEEYFHKDGFKRLMNLCRDKYISLSHIGGSVVLKNTSDDERSAIGGLLGKVYDGGDIKVSLKELDKALLN
ncbi:MAG: TIGR02679 domain-containing protein, partial [Hominilimicola sp.]